MYNIIKTQLRTIIAKNFYLLKIFIKLRSIINPDKNETGGTSDSNYIYSLFLRTFDNYYTINKNIPKHVLEVGCGDSNIVSLLWVLVGSKSVVAIDAFNHLKKDKLYSLFKKSSDLLISRNFCQLNINPRLNLDIYENLWKVLPSKDILINRQKLILGEIKNYLNGNDSNLFSYDSSYTINKVFSFKFDFIFSQAVFEHIKNPKEVLVFLHNNLTEKGIIYTNVDFKSHGVSTLYNGHYILNESQYKFISSTFVFRYINRLPPSWFREVFESSFNLIHEEKIILNNNIKLNNFIESDLEIGSSLFISSK
jgi:hypothetical protein